MTALDTTTYTGHVNPAVRWARPWLRSRIAAVAATWHSLADDDQRADITALLREAQNQPMSTRDVELLTCLRITACQDADALDESLYALGGCLPDERDELTDAVLHLIHEAVGASGWNDLLLVTSR